MPAEPSFERTIALIDAQNLFHHVRNAFPFISC